MYFPFYKNISRNIRIFQKTLQRNKSELITLESRQSYENTQSRLLSKLRTESASNPIAADRLEKIAECISYDKDLFRGSLATFAYKNLNNAININEGALHQIETLAWGAEMVNSYFIILNDLDKSREKSVWCNYDPSMLRSFVYEILKLEFHEKPPYSEILHLFNKAFLNTTAGHILDEMLRNDYKNFTAEKYQSIADLKTSFHTIELPISLATKIIGEVDTRLMYEIQTASTQLGRLYHMQDDFLECYGEETDQSGIPKHSYDIQSGRCSWLAVTALQRCTPAQRIVFTACYGSKEPAHIERIKLLYDQLQMPKIYREEKDKLCEHIAATAKQTAFGDKVVLKVLDVIKDRDSV
ncbi:polyprenyl synthetase domain-containing protein [Phthorimaea operculella]|nr:polyprenyl synthetase domain-containing protein [Phthorimaea operculella]